MTARLNIARKPRKQQIEVVPHIAGVYGVGFWSFRELRRLGAFHAAIKAHDVCHECLDVEKKARHLLIIDEDWGRAAGLGDEAWGDQTKAELAPRHRKLQTRKKQKKKTESSAAWC